MKRSRFSENQIIKILKEAEAGLYFGAQRPAGFGNGRMTVSNVPSIDAVAGNNHPEIDVID